MATIIQRIDQSIAALRAEKDRIQAQAATDIAAVNAKLDVLRSAKVAITPDVEAAYTALLAAGFIKEQ